jgi:hypothetical protein
VAKVKIFGLKNLGAIEGEKCLFPAYGVSGFLKEYAEIWILKKDLEG